MFLTRKGKLDWEKEGRDGMQWSLPKTSRGVPEMTKEEQSAQWRSL